MRVGTPSGGMEREVSFHGQLARIGQGAHERSMHSPLDAGGATMGVFIYLDDVDKHFEVAKAAGAEIVHPPKDVEYGRTYRAVDPEDIPGSLRAPRKQGRRTTARLCRRKRIGARPSRRLSPSPSRGRHDLDRLARFDLGLGATRENLDAAIIAADGIATELTRLAAHHAGVGDSAKPAEDRRLHRPQETDAPQRAVP